MKMKRIFYIAAVFLAGWMTGIFMTGNSSAGIDSQVRTITVYDTIPYSTTSIRDSVVVRYETRRLPIAAVRYDTICDTVTVSKSEEVIVPITQKEYEDSTYHAWVSGYAVNLDSIYTYTRHDIHTTMPTRVSAKRWHIGPTIGYGYTPNGFQPYFGVSVTYSLYSW